MEDYKKYIEDDRLQDATHIEVNVYYSKGGMNYFTGRVTPRGYYISVKPVTKREGIISYVLFSGSGQLLLETNRYSDKQFARAVEMSKDVEKELVAAVTEKYKAA